MPTIALVDDDRNILTSISIALEAEGYRITTYTDGASALDGFKTAPPDLAILDIKMPRMDGMETLRRLRHKSDLPVIFLTSKDEEIDELFGLKMDADDFIRKPFSQRILVERVKAVLRRFSPKDSSSMPKEAESKVLERGQLRMDPERRVCTWKNEAVTLTATELSSCDTPLVSSTCLSLSMKSGVSVAIVRALIPLLGYLRPYAEISRTTEQESDPVTSLQLPESEQVGARWA